MPINASILSINKKNIVAIPMNKFAPKNIPVSLKISFN